MKDNYLTVILKVVDSKCYIEPNYWYD